MFEVNTSFKSLPDRKINLKTLKSHGQILKLINHFLIRLLFNANLNMLNMVNIENILAFQYINS